MTKTYSKKGLTLMFCLMFASYFSYGQNSIVSIVPKSKTSVGNCIPFGSTSYKTSGMVYKNIPAFTIRSGDKLKFDLGRTNNVDIKRNIYIANLNSSNSVQGGWTKIVSNSQTPLNPKGNTIKGDYELTYTVDASFTHSGGRLAMAFNGTNDSGCDQVNVATTNSDSSGKFDFRFYNHTSLSTGVISRGGTTYLWGFKFETGTAPLSSNANLSSLTITAGTLSSAFASETTNYRATVSNGTTSVKVTPTKADANATIKVNGQTVTSGAASGDLALNVGSNTITTIVTAQDASAKTYTLTITRAPTAIAKDITVYLDTNGTVSIAPEDIDNGSTGDYRNVTLSIDTTTFDCFSIGDNRVTLTVTDAEGNSSTATANVRVLDKILPEITAPDNIITDATSALGAIVNYTAPVGTDNCSVTTALTAGFADGATFPIGTTKVTYVATDGSGHSGSASFNVEVLGIAPVISALADITVNNDTGECGAVVSYLATEEITGIPASEITYTIASGSDFSLGTVSVTATATNAVGFSSSTFDVTVVDNEAPTIAPLTAINANSDENCSAVLTIPTPNVTDNCSELTLGNGLNFDGINDIAFINATSSINTADQ
ncbi:MAG: hypothetical protein ACI9D4_002471, partial [Polaribacter sp.]